MALNKRLTSMLFSISIIVLPISSFALTDYTVAKGDTLWGIAVKNKVPGVSTSEMIQAIKGLNITSSPGVVDNIVRLGDNLSIPSTKVEVTNAINQLDQAQNSYQKVQRNGDHSEKAVTTDNQKVAESVQPSQTQAATKKATMQPSEQNNPKQVLPNQAPSNNHAIISSVDQQTHMTKTDSGYTLSISQNTKPTEDSSGGFGSKIIWIIVILLIGLLIVRKVRKNRKNKPSRIRSEYHSNGPRDASLASTYDQPVEVDASNISEVLVEAMLLINESRFDDARHTLQQTLKLKPDSIEIRMKLMEVYAASGDEISFNSERDYLAAHLMRHDDERWQEIDDIYHQYFIARG